MKLKSQPSIGVAVWRRAPLLFVLVVAVGSASHGTMTTLQAQGQTDFVVVTQLRGIDVNVWPEQGGDFGSGAAFVDYDNDGDLDLYVAMGPDEANRLYRYDSDRMVYTEVAGALGCADSGSGKGVKFADYDNDGDQDLFVANYKGANRLYRNDDGRLFVDVTSEARLGYVGQSYGAAWGDYDNDGWLDLYVCDRNRSWSDLLYHNNGDGTFTNVTESANVKQVPLTSCEAVWLDYDHDGDQDLYVSVDGFILANKLYRNNGNGAFTDVSEVSGAGVVLNAMGIAIGDYDNDGWEDLYITNSGGTEAKHVMLRSTGNNRFEDVSAAMGVDSHLWGWGTEFLDHDNDGDLDLYVVHQRGGNIFYENVGDRFVDITDASGVGDRENSYGMATGDYNNDGRVDIFVVNRQGPSILYENTLGENSWLKVRTIGRMGRVKQGVTASNRDGVGARVRVVAGTHDQFRVIRAGSSYLCLSSQEVEFGFGSAKRAELVQVKWPSGIVDTLTDVALDQTITVCEGGWPVEFDYVRAGVSEDRRGISLSWNPLCDGTISGYRLYRETAMETDDGPVFDGIEVFDLLDHTARAWKDETAEPGVSYRYAVSAVGPNGEEIRSTWVEATTPSYIELRQNYPNPFNPTTNIAFRLESAGPVRLAIYDVHGALVEVLLDTHLDPGEHEVVWRPGIDTSRRATAAYFYRLETPDATLTRKMILLK